jgi:hypothetical protein
MQHLRELRTHAMRAEGSHVVGAASANPPPARGPGRGRYPLPGPPSWIHQKTNRMAASTVDMLLTTARGTQLGQRPCGQSPSRHRFMGTTSPGVTGSADADLMAIDPMGSPIAPGIGRDQSTAGYRVQRHRSCLPRECSTIRSSACPRRYPLIWACAALPTPISSRVPGREHG